MFFKLGIVKSKGKYHDNEKYVDKYIIRLHIIYLQYFLHFTIKLGNNCCLT